MRLPYTKQMIGLLSEKSRKALLEELCRKAESGEDWAEICRLEAEFALTINQEKL